MQPLYSLTRLTPAGSLCACLVASAAECSIKLFQYPNTKEGSECMKKKKKPYKHLHLPGRNKHHLTPQCRHDQPFHGSSPKNLILIKTDRHDFLNRYIGQMTLEELIIILENASRVFGHRSFPELCAILKRIAQKKCRTN